MFSLESLKTNRTQNRTNEVIEDSNYSTFSEEVDTDFTIEASVKWANQIKQKWQNGNNNYSSKVPGPCKTEDIDKIVNNAIDEKSKWKKMTDEERFSILKKVANNLRKHRGDLIGAAAFNTGKIFSEGDAEVSEAIDFANYYTYSCHELKQNFKQQLQITPKGVGLVISPWNFPIAIPAGGMLASLASGNNVIFKPSNLSAMVGYLLCEIFWEAGVPKDALQFVNSEGETSRYLTKHEGIDFIIFTGGTETALNIIQNKPDLYIAAETGGKNVTIATQYSDRDQVIKNILHSAFSNTGQKCSATSILALHSELYNDQKFLDNLIDAVKSLTVGDPFDFTVKIGPMVREPSGDLKWALTELEEEEEWLLKPRKISDKICTPGIKFGTKFGSKTHFTEFFGPVLAIMEFKNLEEAIKIVNASGYGLTSGLESLDEREQEYWKNKIKCGNLYINRVTTGALVRRQPFGGMGKSSFGTGIKAGGINYVTQFLSFKDIGNTQQMDISDINIPEADLIKKIDNHEFNEIAANYLRSFTDYFDQEMDYVNIPGQHNICRFVKTNSMAIRVQKEDSETSILSRIFAAKLCVKKIVASVDDKAASKFYTLATDPRFEWLFDNVKTITENSESLASVIVNYNRVRYDGNNVPECVFDAASKFGIYISRTPVLKHGRIELLQYLQEQSISHNYHRYGHISGEK